RSGVTAKLEAAADIAAIKALNPDAVVIATGSVPRVPHDVEGLNQAHVVQGWDVMQGKAQTGKRVAVISQEDYYETPCVAEFLAAQGKEVTVFHKSVHLGSEIARYSIGMVHKRMEEFNVTVKTNLVLTKVDGKAIELASAWGGKSYREEGFDSVVLVYASTAKCELYDQLKADGSVKQLYLAGAAWLPRHMAESTRHGANIGLSI
ncbi:MAG: FAD-dependent oxidoreductase, partial [Sterolibacterium sp.]|nr:FAD-dependent oxidoreductase [Sterolibacterium sp.]